MNKEKQRMAIAKSVGWKDCHENENWAATIGTLHEVGGNRYAVLPDYINDLNAMHDAEMTLCEDPIFRNYEAMLDKVVPMNERWIFATAAQRAEAYLKTIKKWKE